jgi:anaerobic selenocysteine-containing dehydrogenase
MRDAFLKRLFAKVSCGICGQKYDVSNIKVLDQEDGLWVLSVYCGSCGTQGLIAAVVQEGNITDIITDLTEGEHDRFGMSGAVGMDDVLGVRNFLKDFDGDFARLFGEK